MRIRARTRPGWRLATNCETRPPLEEPTSTARLIPTASIKPNNVAGEILGSIAIRGPAGITAPALRGRIAVQRHRKTREDTLEIPPGLDVGVYEHHRDACRIARLCVGDREPARQSDSSYRDRAARAQRARAVYERLGVHRPAWESPDGLTRRECEVLTLVADGRSNRQIGEALYISDRTVARHLTNIFHKIAITSRTQAARYAIDHRLTVSR